MLYIIINTKISLNIRLVIVQGSILSYKVKRQKVILTAQFCCGKLLYVCIHLSKSIHRKLGGSIFTHEEMARDICWLPFGTIFWFLLVFKTYKRIGTLHFQHFQLCFLPHKNVQNAQNKNSMQKEKNNFGIKLTILAHIFYQLFHIVFPQQTIVNKYL